MGWIDRMRDWLHPRTQQTEAAVVVLPQEMARGIRGVGAILPQPEREQIPREVVECTPWTEIEFDGEAYGEMRHAILRDSAGFWTRLEDSQVEIAAGIDQPIARGPFPSLQAARGAAREEVAEIENAWSRQVTREQEMRREEELEQGEEPEL